MAAWPSGAQILSFKTEPSPAAPAVPYSCIEPNDPRSPETIGLTGVAGMGCVAVEFWSLICCWVNGIFLRSVSDFSGKRGQPSGGNFWSLGDSDPLA